MKKSNKKGFVLAETIAVSVVIMTSLVIIYTQFMSISKSYARTFTYNSVNNLYLVNNIKNYIKSDGLNNLISALSNSNYVDITSCSTDYFTEYIYCETLMDNLNVRQVIFTKTNLDELKNNMNGLSEKMKQFVNYINYKNTSGYRIIVEFNDETYTTLTIDSDTSGIGESLISLLLKQYNPDNTTGLVKDSTNENLYYYTGTNEEVANNFLWYGGHQWRVLEFDTSANTLTLITQQPLTAIQPASVVWSTEDAYNNSYMNKWLNEYFWNSLDSSIQATIQDTTFNIGIYADIDEITTTKKVGLLDEDQYERAGSADSFLDIKDYWWLGNSSGESYYCDINDSGTLDHVSVSTTSGVRAVIKISDLAITGGDGTLANNYRVATKATNTDNVQVGEYINVPYSGSDNACGSDNMCTFRVVSKDEDSIKVVLNGLLSAESSYGSSTTITTSHTIYTPLNTFAEGISNTYRYTGNKTFYIGDYPSGANYEDVQDETLEASVGLPTVGEMFSGNDIDMAYPADGVKTFVDVNTIENPTASISYWTMNRGMIKSLLIVYYKGIFTSGNPTNAYGVRAVIYLKSGLAALEFSGGEGTPNSPYVLQ